MKNIQKIVQNKIDISSGHLGIAGEYFVAGELTRRGYIASITLRNTEGVDILCASQNLDRKLSIQVKTSRSDQPSWIFNEKSEKYHSNNFFYILVLLNNLQDQPKFYIVPSKVVSDYITKSHSEWLKGTKKNGDVRKDSTMRKFNDSTHQYKDRWDLLSE